MDTKLQPKPKLDSKILKCPNKTIFFDTYEAKNKSKYLRITESRYNKDTKQSVRYSIILFKEDIEEFKKTLEEVKLD
ncbi:MAG: DUF3276 family protein [Patescibacteria group bacterium]|jgi:hypothetical protein